MTDPYVLPEVFVSLGVIVLAWRYGFEPLRRDEFRCQIRKIRDELFDFMWQNNLDYRDVAYQEARSTLNSVIYLSGAMRPITIIVSLVLAVRRTQLESAAKTIQSADPRIQNAINIATKMTSKALLNFLFMQGIFGVLIRTLYWFLCAIQFVQRIKNLAFLGADLIISNANRLVFPKIPMRWNQ